MKKGLVISGGCLIALAPLIVLASTAYTLMLPNIYRSQARIAIAEDMPIINPFDEQCEAIVTSNSCFLQMQFEIIQSQPILYEVINRLDLQQAWGRDGENLSREVALKKLQNRLQVFQSRDISLLIIRISCENPDEAAQVANELAETYRDYRLDQALKGARRKIDVIEEAIKEQIQRMDAAEEKLQQLPSELVPTANPGGIPIVDELMLQQLESDRFLATKEMLEKESVLKALDEASSGDLTQRVPSIQFDQPFDQLIINTLRQLQDVDVKLATVESEYGSNHPEVRRYLFQKEVLEERLRDQLEPLRNGLETDRLMAKNKLESLDAVLAQIRSDTIESQSEKYRPFRIAMAELENERFIYNQLKTKHQQEIITLEEPRNPVEIIDVAEPNRRPVGPNLFKNVVIAIIAASVCGLAGGVLLNLGLKKSRAGTYTRLS